MRVTTAFNKLLGLNATFVQAVNFEPGQIIVTVRLARRRLRCPDCTFSTRAIYDHRPKPSKWRHLDVCGQPLVIACSLRRLACPNHGVRIEQVPFARPGTRVTYDFENLVVWCVTSMDRTAAAVRCRVAWRAINKIIERVVSTTSDLSRIEELVPAEDQQEPVCGIDWVLKSRGEVHARTACVSSRRILNPRTPERSTKKPYKLTMEILHSCSVPVAVRNESVS